MFQNMPYSSWSSVYMQTQTQAQDMRIRKTMASLFPEPELDEEDEGDKADEEEEWDPAEEEQESPPPPDVGTEFSSSCKTSAAARQYANLFKVPPEYDLRAPTAGESAQNPPAGYATVYVGHFKCGLRLPLPPLVLSVLGHYNLALAQLIPRAIFSLLRFTGICETLRVDPTLDLFRYYFQIRKLSKHMEGWYTFFSRKKTPKLVREEPPNCARNWKNSFLFFRTAPMNVSFSWNSSLNMSLAGIERPSAGIIRRFKAYMKSSSLPLESEDEDCIALSELPRKRLKTVAECSNDATEPPPKILSTQDAVSSWHLRPVQSEEFNATEAAAKKKTPEQFSRSIQECVSSFNQLQRDKEHLEKVVEAKERELKDRDNEIASLQVDKVELQKTMAALEHDVSKDKDKVIASLQDDNDLLTSEVSKLKRMLKIHFE